MNVFRELSLSGPGDALKALLESIDRSLGGGWTRSEELEHSLVGSAQEPALTRRYSCAKNADRPSADLWVMPRNRGELYVPNIIPNESRDLTIEQFNAILQEFYDRFAREHAARLGVEACLTAGEIEIDRLLSPPAMRALRMFSHSANKASAAAHPMDRRRWNDFLSNVHRDRCALDSDLLERWLEEEEGWPEDVAQRLSLEYEKARELLACYDEAS